MLNCCPLALALTHGFPKLPLKQDSPKRSPPSSLTNAHPLQQNQTPHAKQEAEQTDQRSTRFSSEPQNRNTTLETPTLYIPFIAYMGFFPFRTAHRPHRVTPSRAAGPSRARLAQPASLIQRRQPRSEPGPGGAGRDDSGRKGHRSKQLNGSVDRNKAMEPFVLSIAFWPSESHDAGLKFGAKSEKL